MPIWAITVCIALGGLLGHALVTAFFYGRLTERVSNIGEELDGAKERLDRHDEMLQDHSRKIYHLLQSRQRAQSRYEREQ